MTVKELLRTASFIQCAICLAVVVIMFARRAQRIFPFLTMFAGVQFCSLVISTALLFFRRSLHLDLVHAYKVYFCAFWVANGLSFVLQILIIYSVFAEAMRPMTGLHAAGKIVFRWVGVVSALVALALVTGPGVFATKIAFGSVVSQLQQGVSVLTICLLVFVCFAVRPLGLTFRSHLFGVSLGLGLTAVVSLIQAAWLTTIPGFSLYSPVYLFSTVGYTVAFCVWGTYFALPEPKRRMILLPTTSPFFLWNRISEILGDAPGHVAVAGFTPDMLAPAEIEMLTEATTREAALDRERRLPSYSISPVPEIASTVHPTMAI